MIPCIIPARGGSKEIPRKNLLPLRGKPLIVWSIEQALQVPEIDYVSVATDDPEIGRVATEHGAFFFRRSAESATDDAPSEIVLREWLNCIKEEPEMVVFLQATSPIRQPQDISEAIARVRAGADSSFSTRHIEGYIWRTNHEGVGCITGPRRPRQEYECEHLEETGSFYVFRPETLKLFGRIGPNARPVPQHPLDGYQLDTPADIPLLETLIDVRLGNGKP